MKSVFVMDQIPLWGVFLLTIVAVLLAIGLGMFMGSRRRLQADREPAAPLGVIISAVLGLLAFMLAFTFGIAVERFQSRRHLLLNEVNTLGTTYLRAGLLPEPHPAEVRQLLREYVELRVNLVKQESAWIVQLFPSFLARSKELQRRLWAHAVALARTNRNSVMDALFVQSLNELITLHNNRVTVFMYRIPPSVWSVLYFISILSMATVGYQLGLSGKGNFKAGLVLALSFAAVILLIVDMDRATEGSLKVSQQPLFELWEKMQTPAQ
jgi:hypothetical protein